MGDDRGSPSFHYVLEAIVAVAIVGTFIVYGFSGRALTPLPQPAPTEVAKAVR